MYFFQATLNELCTSAYLIIIHDIWSQWKHLEQFENKRPMGHIAQLRNSSSLNTFPHSYDHTIMFIDIISFLSIEWFLFVKSWNPVTKQRMLCAKVVWNWPKGSEEEDFEISSVYSRYFVIISNWLKDRVLYLNKLESFLP